MSEIYTFQIGALGDSISVGFNADVNGLNEHHSWSTRDLELVDGGSHLTRIRRIYPDLKVKAVNVAAVGAKSADLSGQVDRLLQVNVPDYVTLMIGANDLTSWLSDFDELKFSAFIADVRTSIDRLIAANPRMMILLVGIPDQSRVLALFAKQRFGAQFGSLLETWVQRPDLQRLVAVYKERWVKANEALAALKQNYSQNVRYSASVAATIFSDEHLSRLDFYHPSILGQRLLAEVTWRDGFFP